MIMSCSSAAYALIENDSPFLSSGSFRTVKFRGGQIASTSAARKKLIQRELSEQIIFISSKDSFGERSDYSRFSAFIMHESAGAFIPAGLLPVANTTALGTNQAKDARPLSAPQIQRHAPIILFGL